MTPIYYDLLPLLLPALLEAIVAQSWGQLAKHFAPERFSEAGTLGAQGKVARACAMTISAHTTQAKTCHASAYTHHIAKPAHRARQGKVPQGLQ